MTEPLTPAGCDLRDFPYMPLDVVRLRDSELAIQVSGEEFRCAVMLWCASWHQVPAASLPDDDVTLSALAGYGRAVASWKAVRENSLRGWVKCDDGRLYHPVVAEKACDAWRAKLQQRWRTEAARIKKHNQRHHTEHPVPEFDEWVSLGCPQGQSLYVPRTNGNVPRTNDDCPEDNGNVSSGTEGGCPDSVPGEIDSKRKGREREREYIKEERDSAGASAPEPAADDGVLKTLRYNGVDISPGNPSVAQWLKAGLTTEEALSALAIARRSKNAPIRMHWNYLAQVLETERNRAAADIPAKAERKPTTAERRSDWNAELQKVIDQADQQQPHEIDMGTIDATGTLD